MKQAEVAILDEPTGGLDPQSTREFLELIRSLKADGMTILLSSHLLDLVQSICDRVALFNARPDRTDRPRPRPAARRARRLARHSRRGDRRQSRSRDRGGTGRQARDERWRRRSASKRPTTCAPQIARAVVGAGGDLTTIAPATPASTRSTRNISRGFAMRREGSAFSGVGTVIMKELADNLTSDADAAARAADLRHRRRRRLCHHRWRQGPAQRRPVRLPAASSPTATIRCRRSSPSSAS